MSMFPQEELEDLSRSFGRLVKTKLNVGANRNQAFIEFPDVNSAVNMVHHFMSSAEPAKVCDHQIWPFGDLKICSICLTCYSWCRCAGKLCICSIQPGKKLSMPHHQQRNLPTCC